MNENVNSPATWLRYLLYVGIAAMANSLLGLFLPGKLSTWIGFAVSAATVYLLFRLISANARYKTAALCSGANLIIGVLNITVLSLASSIFAIVAQYQEYQAHSELIAERDPKLAGKWSSLFWLQFGVELIMILLTGLFVGVLVAASGMDAAVVTGLVTVIVAVFSVVLKVLYLSYLNRTVKLLEEA